MIHIELDPYKQAMLCQIGSRSLRCCQSDPASFWLVMTYLREREAFVIFIRRIQKLFQ